MCSRVAFFTWSIRVSVPSAALFVCPWNLYSYSRHSSSLTANPPAPRPAPPEFATHLAQNRRRSIPRPSTSHTFFASLAAPCASRGRGACLLADAPSPAFCGYPSTAPSGLGLNSHLPCGCLLDRIVPLLCWRTKGYMTLPNLASYRKPLPSFGLSLPPSLLLPVSATEYPYNLGLVYMHPTYSHNLGISPTLLSPTLILLDVR